MRWYEFGLLLASGFWIIDFAYSGLSDAELLDTILSEHFDVRVRPRASAGSGKPANVAVSLSLLHIHSLDINKAELDLTFQITLGWTDHRLGWAIRQTQNEVRRLVLPDENVWTPDITISNAIGKIVPIHEKEVIIEWMGRMASSQTYRATVGCTTNTTSDEQTCVLQISSWSYDVSNMDIYTTTENLTAKEDFFSHEWELLDSYVERVNQTRNGELYACLEASLNLRHLESEETQPTPETSRMTQKMVHEKNFACVVSPSVVLKILAIGLFALTSL